MAAPSAFEQYLLEQINFARLDPQADFARYISSYDPLTSDDPRIQFAFDEFNVDGSVLRAQVEALQSAAPLAWNDALNESATTHSERMIAADAEAPNLGGVEWTERIRDAGYNFTWVAENLYGRAVDAAFAHAALMVDWAPTATGILDAPSHRINILNPTYREVGIGAVEQPNESALLGPWVITQDFGTRAGLPQTFFVGHVRNEEDGDGFYSIGEGVGGIRVDLIGGPSMTTPDAGGFNIATRAGPRTVTFSGDELARDVRVVAEFEAENAKIDLIDGSTLATTVSLTLGDGARNAFFIADQGTDLTGNNAKNRLTGNDLDNDIEGGGGKDRISAEGGDDTADGGGGKDKIALGAGDDRGLGGKGNDQVSGGEGDDTIVGGAGRDKLSGQDGEDRIEGGGGNDRLSGGDDADVFVFSGRWGSDTVVDLDADDRVRIAERGMDSRADLRDALTDTSRGALYDHNGDGKNTILFVGETVDSLDLSHVSLG